MPNYAATDYTTTSESLSTVLANMETHLETRDSTNNPVFCIDIIQNGDGTLYTGIIVTKGA